MAAALDSVTPRMAMSREEFLVAGEAVRCRTLEDGRAEFNSPAGKRRASVISNRVAWLRAPLKARREWIDPKGRAAEVKCPDRASLDFESPGPLVNDGVNGFALELKTLVEV